MAKVFFIVRLVTSIYTLLLIRTGVHLHGIIALMFGAMYSGRLSEEDTLGEAEELGTAVVDVEGALVVLGRDVSIEILNVLDSQEYVWYLYVEEGENVVDSASVVVVDVVVVVGSGVGVVMVVVDGSSVWLGSSVWVDSSDGHVSSVGVVIVVGAGVVVVATGVVVVNEEESPVVDGTSGSSVVVDDSLSVAVELLAVERLPAAAPGQELDDPSSEAVGVAVDRPVDLFVVIKPVSEEEESDSSPLELALG